MSILSFAAAVSLMALANHGQMADVATSAEMAKPISVGARVPAADLLTVEDKPVTLRAVIRHKPTVIIFYRGSWCPFCNKHLSDLVRVQPKLKEMGYQIVAITPDRPEELNHMMEKNQLTYTLLSDCKTEAMRRFGVAWRVDDSMMQKLTHYGVDLEKSSGNTLHILPVPSLFIVDRSGTIRYVHSNPDYKVRLSGDEVVAAAQNAGVSKS